MASQARRAGCGPCGAPSPTWAPIASFSYYDRVQTGQLVTRLTNDVEQIRQFAGNGIVQLAAATVMLAGSTVLLLALNWRLALVALAIMPVILTLIVRYDSRHLDEGERRGGDVPPRLALGALPRALLQLLHLDCHKQKNCCGLVKTIADAEMVAQMACLSRVR